MKLLHLFVWATVLWLTGCATTQTDTHNSDAAAGLAGTSHSMLPATYSGDNSVTAYAEMPKKAAWPKLTRPVQPTSNCKLSANSA